MANKLGPYINYYQKIVEWNKGVHPDPMWLQQILEVDMQLIDGWRSGGSPRRGHAPYKKLQHLYFLLIEGKIDIEDGEDMEMAYKVPVTEWKQRTCLNCQRLFDSYGKQNRVCSDCKSNTSYAEASASDKATEFYLTRHKPSS